jgi:CRP-like cAMP-binding protein
LIQNEIFRSAERRVFRKGEVIFYQGSVGAEYWILIKGHAAVLRNKEGLELEEADKQNPSNEVQQLHSDRQELGVHVHTLKAGDGFGHMAILLASPRSATVVAEGYRRSTGPVLPTDRIEDTEAIMIPREVYIRCIRPMHMDSRSLDSKLEFFRTLYIFHDWQPRTLMHMALTSRNRRLHHQNYLFKKGDVADTIFIVTKGELRLQITSLEHQGSGNAYTTASDKKTIGLELLGPLDIFFPLASKHTCDAFAMCDCEMVTLTVQVRVYVLNQKLWCCSAFGRCVSVHAIHAYYVRVTCVTCVYTLPMLLSTVLESLPWNGAGGGRAGRAD